MPLRRGLDDGSNDDGSNADAEGLVSRGNGLDDGSNDDCEGHGRMGEP